MTEKQQMFDKFIEKFGEVVEYREAHGIECCAGRDEKYKGLKAEAVSLAKEYSEKFGVSYERVMQLGREIFGR